MTEHAWHTSMTYDEVVAAYDPLTWPTARTAYRNPILTDALRHSDERVRQWLSNRLLDDGADATAIKEVTTLHILLYARRSYPDVDVPLMRRLIAAGVDVNRSCGKWGRPVQMLWGAPAEVADAMFEIDGLDLLSPDGFGVSALDMARRNRGNSPEMYERVVDYLTARGQLPTAHFADAASWATRAEFDAGYRPEAVNDVDPATGATVLLSLLRNTALRGELVPRVLADGADMHASLPDGRTALHVLLGAHRDPVEEAALAQALIEHGADPNRPRPKIGTPLNELSWYMNFPEDRLAPLYDVILAAPGLDPMTLVGRTKTCWDLLQKKKRMRPVLLARVQALLDGRTAH